MDAVTIASMSVNPSSRPQHRPALKLSPSVPNVTGHGGFAPVEQSDQLCLFKFTNKFIYSRPLWHQLPCHLVNFTVNASMTLPSVNSSAVHVPGKAGMMWQFGEMSLNTCSVSGYPNAPIHVVKTPSLPSATKTFPWNYTEAPFPRKESEVIF